MKKKNNWSMDMQSSDVGRSSVRGPVLFGIIAGIHALAILGFLVIQGCGTKQPMVEPPPAPLMPPRADVDVPAVTAVPRPAFQPPVAVEQAPSSLDATSVQTYTVASGDSLSKIANRFGVTPREIAQLNGIKDPNKIRVGQSLKLPSYASASEGAAVHAPKATAQPKVAKKASTPAVAGSGEYTVQSGDSLSKIAVKHGTTVKALKEVNKLQSDVIRIGQKLKLPEGTAAKSSTSATKPAASAEKPKEAAPAPAPVPAVESAAPEAVTPAPEIIDPVPSAPLSSDVSSSSVSEDNTFAYIVKPGDTLDDVARSFSLLKEDILKLNNLSEDATLSSGQRLKLPMSP